MVIHLRVISHVMLKRHILDMSSKMTNSKSKPHLPGANQWVDSSWHYSDVIMSAMASQITGVSIVCLHRENSPITQNTPEPTFLSLGGWPRENKKNPKNQKKKKTTPGHTAKPSLIARLSGHSDTIVLEQFDVTLLILRCATNAKFA